MSAYSLSKAEVRLIKGMLGLFPRPSYQEVLAYFTWPGREINHRVISEIASGRRWSAEPSASRQAVRAFMDAARRAERPDPSWFVTGSGSGGGPSFMAYAGELALNWWPVGQGLFATGSLDLAGRRPLVWVYDCGSSSGASHVDDALDAFAARTRGRAVSRLALVALSHFDRDHISGMVRLISRFRIRRLILPYVPLWQRLLVAAEQGIGSGDPVMPFFIDPAAYISGIEGSEIEEILFVPASGPDDVAPPAPEGAALPPGDPDRRGEEDADPPELKPDYGNAPPEAEGDPMVENDPGRSVRFLARGGRLVVPGAWEFVPYNDAGMLPKATPRFLRRAVAVAKVFLNQPSRRTKALATLKAIYGHHFGRSPTARNVISLFLYSGPQDPRAIMALCRSTPGWGIGWSFAGFSQLHTGDGYLDTQDRLDRLVAFYTKPRVSRSGILQVMHHGARKNWHSGVAAALAPAISIFCSDPGHHYGHPHAEVLRDFWTFGPVQVDDKSGFDLTGLIAMS